LKRKKLPIKVKFNYYYIFVHTAAEDASKREKTKKNKVWAPKPRLKLINKEKWASHLSNATDISYDMQ
jgi:hypothetical protein